MRDAARIRVLLSWGAFLVLPCYLVDQVSKLLVLKNLPIGEAIPMLPGYFEFLHVRNTGAAFGILQGLPDPFRTFFFLAITVAACAAIVMIFRASGDESAFLKVVLCLILAGALGNLTDRLVHKEVVDFINVHIRQYHWPTFNIADTYISVGMLGLLGYMLKGSRQKP
ncbi:MAG: signal peptidase II [Syntrophaceae bacterium]